MNDELKLLIEWPSRWDGFVSSIRPALGKSPRPLAGEARTGLFPHQGMLITWICEAVLLLAAIVLPTKLAFLAPYQPPSLPKYDVIYFSGDELPQTEDLGGAKVGRTGKAGGQEAFHRTQVIRVSRGDLLREKVVDAPRLNLPQVNSAVANLLAYNPLPGPPPAEGLRASSQAPSLQQNVVAPAPDVRRDKMLVAPAMETAVAPSPDIHREKFRQSPSMNAAVVPPSPSGIQRDVTLPRVPGSQVIAVVPPPVSAPERMTTSHAQLTLPAPSVVSPPPSQVEREAALRGPGFGPGELQKQIVPPPVQVGSNGSTRSYGGIGNQNVVPPPVQLNGAANGHSTVAMLGNPSVVAPPVQASGVSSGRVAVDRWGIPRAVPPPVQVDNGSMRQAMGGLDRGNAVVPPPPSVSADTASGMGHGNRGRGLGSPFDSGSVTAPPTHGGGGGNGSGVVLSSQPGSTVAKPGSAGAGALALSPNGGATPGLGGPGGGGDIARGQGSGAALIGQGPGAANSNSGTGADTIAHNGISPYPGTGGAGTGSVNKPAMPGVSVHGGSNVITLPSFGADTDPASIGRSSKLKSRNGPDITVVGSSRSGGAFNLYGELKGDKVYTIYIDTTLGPAVMEYADPTSANHPYAEDLVAPQPMRADLPANMKISRTVISCVLDRSGLLRNPQVLEGNRENVPKILAALSGWKFRPVFRGDQPIEVTAILGFHIDTR